MNKYRDILEGMIAELTETPDDKQFLAKAKIKWGKSDEPNKNDRYYPDSVATPAIEKFNKEAQKNVGVCGQLDHPMGTGSTLLANVSHLVTRVWKDKEKVWWADAKIMRTSRGRDLLAVLKTGTKIGASLRGIGEIDSQGKVKPGLQIRAIDFVSSPSFGANATVDKTSVFESYVPDEKYEFSEEDLEKVTSAMDELSDESVAMIQEKLKKSDHIEMTKEQVKALPIWIRLSKDDPNIAPFHKWFEEQQQLFGLNTPQDKYAMNEELMRQSITKQEKNIAGVSYGIDRKRIEDRQRQIDEALSGKTMTEKTVSRLFAEYCLAGGHLSRAEYIKKFGF